MAHSMQPTLPNTPSAVLARGRKKRAGWGRFLLRFGELQLAMAFGAVVCYSLGRSITTSPFAEVYRSGTYLYALGDVVYLAGSVVVWMIIRGYGWRRGLEMGLVIVMPLMLISVLGEIGDRPLSAVAR